MNHSLVDPMGWIGSWAGSIMNIRLARERSQLWAILESRGGVEVGAQLAQISLLQLMHVLQKHAQKMSITAMHAVDDSYEIQYGIP